MRGWGDAEFRISFFLRNCIYYQYTIFMKTYHIILFSLIVFFTSCDETNTTFIEGAYVREWTFEQERMNGSYLGKSQIRDTIFIHKKQENFEVTNYRWWLNDYDEEGWQRRLEGTLRGYKVHYDRTDSTLNSTIDGMYAPLFLDGKGNLYKGRDRTTPWKKVN